MSTAPKNHHELSVSLPNAIQTHIHIHLTIHSHHLLLFLTTRSLESNSGPAPLGSFVYAMPSKNAPISTPLYIREPSFETATRIAKILCNKTARPVYVGNSMDFSTAGRGGDVSEEMAGVKTVIDTVVELVKADGDESKLSQGVESLLKEKGVGE